MNHKTKLFMTIASMCLVLCLGIVGILAVKTLNMSVGGNITFSADGLDFSISDGTFETTAGAEYPGVNSDTTKLKGFAMNTNTKESDVATQKASWTGLNLTMSSLGDVVLVFTVTNNMTEDLVTTIEVTTLGTNTNNNMEINVVGGTVTKGTPKEMSITFHIKDTNINAGLTGFAVAVSFAKEVAGATIDNPVDSTILPKLTFTPTTGNEVSVKDNGYVGELIIPAYVEIDGITYMVSQIEEHGFHGNENITSVYIPATVKINDYSFRECTSLVKVGLQEGTKSIGSCAFADCTALTEIRLPASLESIGNHAFSVCTNLKTVYMDCNPGFIVEQSCIYNNTDFVYINKNITPTSSFTKVGEEGNYYKYTETLHYYGGGASN